MFSNKSGLRKTFFSKSSPPLEKFPTDTTQNQIRRNSKKTYSSLFV